MSQFMDEFAAFEKSEGKSIAVFDAFLLGL